MSVRIYSTSALIAAFVCASISTASAADTPANKDEAVAMVKKGIVFIKANGKEKASAEVTNKAGQFKDRDLYLTVYGLDGVVRAHGANEKMVGKNLIERWKKSTASCNAIPIVRNGPISSLFRYRKSRSKVASRYLT